VWQSLRYSEQVLSMAVMAHVPNQRKDQPVIVTDYWMVLPAPASSASKKRTRATLSR
jgi:hypothetical protein